MHKRFGAHAILQGADLEVPTGSSTAILGPSGTGKSVLIKHVLGLLRPDAGEIIVNGQRLGKMGRHELVMLRRGIGVMFQDGALFSSMTVFENVAFPLQQHTDLPDREICEIAGEHLTAVGLWNARELYPGDLSGGMRKRAGLARALALDPPILVCDEPDSGLDPVRTALLGDLLAERHREMGGTMLVISHNIELVRRTCDVVAVLWQGRFVWTGRTEDAFASDDPFVRQFLAAETAGPLGMDA